MALRRSSFLVPLVLLALVLGLGLGLAVWTDPPVPPAAPAEAATAANASVVQTALIAATEKVGPAVVSVKTERGQGTGVIYDRSGYVVTNAHVVAGARSIQVDLADGRRFSAEVLGADSGFDLAVLKIDGENLPVATLGSSANLKPGHFVVAIGNPYGFDHTITVGVVSALSRPIAGSASGQSQPMIQTDAAINPGNSGGPLVDLDGNVVGINTLVAAPQGFPAQGLGFAVPADTVSRIAPQLVKDGHVTNSGRPYFGFGVTDHDTARTATRSRTGSAPSPAANGPQAGALVGEVQPGGPADRAGIAAGDIIVAFNGKDIYSADSLLQELVLRTPGDQVTLTVHRNGERQQLTLTLGEAPAGRV